METIEIPLSKTKLFLTITGSVLFVVMGVYLFTTVANQQTRFNPGLVKGTGLAGIIFFGATGIFGIKKLFDRKPGMVIDEYGIIDNSSSIGAGFIKWQDITGIRTERVMSSSFLLIFVKDPSSLLDRKTGLKRKLMKANLDMYGTPVAITSNTLKYSFANLEKLLRERLEASHNIR